LLIVCMAIIAQSGPPWPELHATEFLPVFRRQSRQRLLANRPARAVIQKICAGFDLAFDRQEHFGSEARGDGGPDSALDFLVVVPDNAPDEIFRPGSLARARPGIPYAADLIPWRQSDFEARAAHVVASLPATVIAGGQTTLRRRPNGCLTRRAHGFDAH
jgi:hypothetical protein